jgi:hypothetical protein
MCDGPTSRGRRGASVLSPARPLRHLVSSASPRGSEPHNPRPGKLGAFAGVRFHAPVPKVRKGSKPESSTNRYRMSAIGRYRPLACALRVPGPVSSRRGIEILGACRGIPAPQQSLTGRHSPRLGCCRVRCWGAAVPVPASACERPETEARPGAPHRPAAARRPRSQTTRQSSVAYDDANKMITKNS